MPVQFRTILKRGCLQFHLYVGKDNRKFAVIEEVKFLIAIALVCSPDLYPLA